jgi:ribosomal protein S18 acetylase RimI-like enzyme
LALIAMSLQIRSYQEVDRPGVLEVWASSGLTRAWNDPDLDIDRKVAFDPEGFLVAELNGAIIGTVMAGYEGHRGWIQYLGVDPAHQRSGVGRALVEAAIDRLCAQGCPKINLQVRRANRVVIAFYEQLGFVEDDVLSMGLRLVDDESK